MFVCECPSLSVSLLLTLYPSRSLYQNIYFIAYCFFLFSTDFYSLGNKERTRKKLFYKRKLTSKIEQRLPSCKTKKTHSQTFFTIIWKRKPRTCIHKSYFKGTIQDLISELAIELDISIIYHNRWTNCLGV